MKLFERIRLSLLIAAIAAAVSVVAAQQSPIPPNVAAAKLDDAVPVDPQITLGRLPNGLRYYIRANQNPQARAELRLVVNAGSVLEEEDQRGLAHFVEHMSFNGTLHFPGLDVVNFMQSLGMRFGAHVNANTSFDETVYELQIPTENPVVIDRALLALEDWAHNVTFDAQEIEKERGVILEEWRQGLGAEERISNKQFPLLLKGSRYADRLPIGTPEIIRNANPERLRQFYKDWYRPDLMGVVVVGDVNKAAVETLIRSHFARFRPRSIRSRVRCSAFPIIRQRHGVYDDYRSRGDEHTHRCFRADAGAPLCDHRRLPAFYVERLFGACCRPASMKSRTRRMHLSARADRSRLARTDGGGDVARCARPPERRRTRTDVAVHRDQSRGALRLHADGAQSREAEHAALPGAGDGRTRQERLRPSRRRIHSQLHFTTSLFRGLSTSTA
jgi:hypothetical protein